ncbi:MAG: S8 family serine peptidase [Candidatus Tectomicrobia bacterium]|nr:S8 family serine peptidase [Candidatus Tectomicrobia bacterium]
MNPLDVVKLTALMGLTSGRPEIRVGLIDGPVTTDHPDLRAGNICQVAGSASPQSTHASSTASRHGTFVAGILAAQRESPAPAICPGCTLLVRPIFANTPSTNGQMPSATPEELAAAILDCVNAGVRVLNLSVALAQPSLTGQQSLEEALRYTATRGVIAVAASGNQGTLGSSPITRHPGVIPVVAYDRRGRPMGQSNLGHVIGRQGVGAPGEAVTSLGAPGQPLTLSGTSVATPFVTGTIALLWSLFPNASSTQVKVAVTKAASARRTTVVPPLLDAQVAYRVMTIT